MSRERVWAGGSEDAWEAPHPRLQYLAQPVPGARRGPPPGTPSTLSLLGAQPRSSSFSPRWVLIPRRTEHLSARWGGHPGPDSWHSRLVHSPVSPASSLCGPYHSLPCRPLPLTPDSARRSPPEGCPLWLITCPLSVLLYPEPLGKSHLCHLLIGVPLPINSMHVRYVRPIQAGTAAHRWWSRG